MCYYFLLINGKFKAFTPGLSLEKSSLSVSEFRPCQPGVMAYLLQTHAFKARTHAFKVQAHAFKARAHAFKVRAHAFKARAHAFSKPLFNGPAGCETLTLS